jgi:alkylation response protein AidB-like acyl-CoA dehydrogenase
MTTDSTDAEIGANVRGWLQQNWDPALPLGEWWAMLAASGWAFPHYPKEWSGRGLSSKAERIVAAELAAAGAYGPPRGIATMMVAPLLLELGTEQQKRDWLPGIVDGTTVWCQLFSEPDAGSDLAGLNTSAVRDGDQWIVNGQKVWTSGAHYARRAILVARTDRDAAKHHGLSFFVIEMDQPGIETRPLVQMTGDAEFNEVFLTNAELPASNLIGDVNEGWGVTLRLLSYERNSLDPETDAGIHCELDLHRPVREYASGLVDDGLRGFMPKGSESWALLHDLLIETGTSGDATIRQEAMRIYSWLQIARYASLRAAASAGAGKVAGPEVSLGKLASTRSMRAWRDLALQVLGSRGMLSGGDAALSGRITRIALSVSGMSIAGGTDEIQRNIIGEQVLGLPREPRTPMS